MADLVKNSMVCKYCNREHGDFVCAKYVDSVAVKVVKIQKYYGTSCVGKCLTCGKEFQDHTRRKQSYKHAKNTGHQVRLELNSVFHYN